MILLRHKSDHVMLLPEPGWQLPTSLRGRVKGLRGPLGPSLTCPVPHSSPLPTLLSHTGHLAVASTPATLLPQGLCTGCSRLPQIYIQLTPSPPLSLCFFFPDHTKIVSPTPYTPNSRSPILHRTFSLFHSNYHLLTFYTIDLRRIRIAVDCLTPDTCMRALHG